MYLYVGEGLEITYVLLWDQVPLVASNRIGKEVIETERGPSEITFYGHSFIAGNMSIVLFINFCNDKMHNGNIIKYSTKAAKHTWGRWCI